MKNRVKKIFINGLEENKTFNEIVDEVVDYIIKKVEDELEDCKQESINIYNKWYEFGVAHDCHVFVKRSSVGGNYTINNMSDLNIHEEDIQECKYINDFSILLVDNHDFVFELILFQ